MEETAERSLGRVLVRPESLPAGTLYREMYLDRLTGAANREFFEQHLDGLLGACQEPLHREIWILFLDLDRFKAVNDTLGHGIGDCLLRLISERIHSALQDTDILARLGGDEFAVLFGRVNDRDHVAELARRLIDLVQRPCLIEGHIINVGLSIGIATAPQDGEFRHALLRSADLALYHSKNAGRGVFTFFTPEMAERAEQRRALELDLRKALVLRQLELHYQPQIDAELQRVTGMEALLRWRHPQRGLLLPPEFLPLAEEIGLSLPIGDWVLRTACRDALAWPGTLTIAINISPLQFENADFAKTVEKTLAATSLPASRLEIEVTEEILLRDPANISTSLEALRGLGVRVAMDSFGTGLASLSQLVNFPLDKIKIDRSVVGRAVGNNRTRAMLRAISALGQGLGIPTLAEGIESAKDLACIRFEGCDTVQGFYYSPALPARDLAAFLLDFPGTLNPAAKDSQ